MSMTSVLIDIIGRDNASRAFDTAAASAARSAKKIDAVSAGLAKTGAAMTRGITVPVLAIAAASTKVAVDYQKSMTLLQTAGGETAKKMAVINKGVQKVAESTGTSLSDLSEGMYTVAKAGASKWSAIDQLKVLKVAAQGAKAENVDLGTSVSALTSIMMGYGLGTGKAVAAENEIIKASGLSKTTMQDFAGSLANVVPLASSLHISFAQVGGAIATMTQHGETADRATQNLSNLITSLAGQNNVASGTMQQLGIKTVQLQKNLGKNGLTGTLDIVEKALAKHSKAGMIVVDAFKKSQLASKSLNTELNAMPKGLANISKAFADGKLSYKTYYADVKDLGGKQYELGKNFITTMQAAKGFNNILKSGKGDQQTAATELKNMLGGVTGMRAALMLGGTSAKQFSDNVKKVGKAAIDAGSDVLGWNKTSSTLAVKMDKAKASLEVVGLEIGTKLIPVVSKMVGWVQQGVKWWDGLSGTQKKVGAWSIGILAAMGPVVMLTSKLMTVGRGISRFAVGAGNMFNRIGTGAEGMSSKATTAIRGMSAAFGGVLIGSAIGTLTANASGATRAIGALASTAAGAAMGFGAGGPLGAAIGGIAGGLSALITQWHGNNDAAKQNKAIAVAALQAEKQASDQLLSSLQAVNGAYNKQYKTQIAHSLESKGALQTASQAGLSMPSVMSVVLGTATQKQLEKFNTTLDLANASGKITNAQYNKLRLSLEQVGAAASDAEVAEKLQNAALGKGILPAKDLGTSVAKLSKAMKGTGTAMVGVGVASNHATAAAQHNTEVIRENAAAIGDHAKKLLAQGKSAGDVASIIGKQSLALQTHAIKLGLDGDAVSKLIVKYAHLPKNVATKLSNNAPLVSTLIAGLIDKYGKIPKSVATALSADPTGALKAVTKVQQAISHINGTIILRTKYSNGAHGMVGAQLADGGAVRGPGTGKSDSVIARLSNGEHVWTADEVQKAGGQGAVYRMRKMVQAGLMKFANGGAISTTTVSGAKKWVYRGTKYASLSAAQNAEHSYEKSHKSAERSKLSGLIGGVGTLGGPSFTVTTRAQLDKVLAQIKHARDVMHKDFKDGIIGKDAVKADKKHLASLAKFAKAQLAESAVEGVLGKVGQVSSPAFTIGQGLGYKTVTAQITAAQKKLDKEISEGLPKSAAKKYQDQIDKYTKLARKELSKLRVKIEAPDAAAIKKALSGTVTGVRSAFASMLADLRQSNASAALIASVKNTENKIADKVSARNKVQSELTNARAKLATAKQAYSQERSSVKGAFTGSFDITSAGQVYNDQAATGASILAAVKKAVANAKTFTSVLKKLRKNGLSASLVAQLAEAGPSALPQAQALLSSGAGTLKAITAQYAELNTVSAGAGKFIADQTKGAGVATAQGLVNGLKSQEAKLDKAINNLTDRMIRQLKKKLKIKSPSQVTHEIGQHVADGLINGMTSRLANLHAAAGELASGAVKAPGSAGALRHASGVHIEHLTITEQSDPIATANATTRRLAMLGAS